MDQKIRNRKENHTINEEITREWIKEMIRMVRGGVEEIKLEMLKLLKMPKEDLLSG